MSEAEKKEQEELERLIKEVRERNKQAQENSNMKGDDEFEGFDD